MSVSFILGDTLQCTVQQPHDEYNSYYDVDQGYPFDIPKVTLEGSGETYPYQPIRDWKTDSVIIKRGNIVYEYCRRLRTEVQMTSPSGEEKWVREEDFPSEEDFFKAQEEGWQCSDERRDVQSFEVIEYDLEKKTKKTYACKLQNEEIMDSFELRKFGVKPEECNEGDDTSDGDGGDFPF